ncbi:MAG: hypothetical protein AAF638_03165 [Pseudomonadota bacterium]
MIRSTVGALSAASLTAMALASNGNAQPLAHPQAAAKAIDEIAALCTSLNGEPTIDETRVAQRVDISGDGILDFEIEAVTCDFGKGPKLQTALYFSDPAQFGSFFQAFVLNLEGYAIRVEDDTTPTFVSAMGKRACDAPDHVLDGLSDGVCVLQQRFSYKNGFEFVAEDTPMERSEFVAGIAGNHSLFLDASAATGVAASADDPAPVKSASPTATADPRSTATYKAAIRQLKTMHTMCRQVGGRMVYEDGHLVEMSLSADGVPDFALDSTRAYCDGAVSMFCGSHGCSLDVFASSGGRVIEGAYTLFDVNLDADGVDYGCPSGGRGQIIYTAGKLTPVGCRG